MLDIISVILSFISVLQGMGNDKKPDQNMSSIASGMNDINTLLRVIMDAKECHDKFEKYHRRVIEDLRQYFEQEDYTSKQVKEKMETVLEVSRDLNTVFDKERVELIVKDDHELSRLPNKIQDSVLIFYRTYPNYTTSIKNTKSAIETIRGYVKKKNFGEDFDRSLILLREFATETKSSADDVMYNALPVIDFMHFELRARIGGLS